MIYNTNVLLSMLFFLKYINIILLFNMQTIFFLYYNILFKQSHCVCWVNCNTWLYCETDLLNTLDNCKSLKCLMLFNQTDSGHRQQITKLVLYNISAFLLVWLGFILIILFSMVGPNIWSPFLPPHWFTTMPATILVLLGKKLRMLAAALLSTPF